MDISKNIPLLIPLFLIIMFSCSHEIMTLFSYSLLGKLFSILLIIYYINLDIHYCHLEYCCHSDQMG